MTSQLAVNAFFRLSFSSFLMCDFLISSSKLITNQKIHTVQISSSKCRPCVDIPENTFGEVVGKRSPSLQNELDDFKVEDHAKPAEPTKANCNITVKWYLESALSSKQKSLLCREEIIVTHFSDAFVPIEFSTKLHIVSICIRPFVLTHRQLRNGAIINCEEMRAFEIYCTYYLLASIIFNCFFLNRVLES